MTCRTVFPFIVAALVGLTTGCAPALVAAPRLVAVWPAAGASLPIARHSFELTFNRDLNADSSFAAVWRDHDGAALPTDTVVKRDDGRRLRVKLLDAEPGDYRLSWHAVAAHGGAAVDGEQAFSLRDESPGAPRLVVSRATADTGDKVQIVGDGFGEDCVVRLSIGDDDQELSIAGTDQRGSFVAEAKVPASVAFGTQPVQAVDEWGATASAALQVRWGGWPPLLVFTTGRSGPGAGEVTFLLSARNRSDYLLERVRVILEDPPDGTLVVAEPAPRRLERAIAWDLPIVDRGVVGPFRATYRVSAPVTSHSRIEFRHRRPHGCSGDQCLPAFISETTSDSSLVYPAD